MIEVSQLRVAFGAEENQTIAVDDVSFMMPEATVYGPVSYTHIDVYKRQSCPSASPSTCSATGCATC